jgi:signal transduction histidine kinase
MSMRHRVPFSSYPPGWRSLGTSLLIYVLLGTLIGLGTVSFFFFRMLEAQIKAQIQGQLNVKVKTVEIEFAYVQQTVHSLSAAVRTLERQGIEDPEAYKNLVLDGFKRRSPLVTGIGFGQKPFQVLRDRPAFWPYISLAQSVPDQPGQRLPKPHDNLKYWDVSEDKYLEKFYYKDIIAGQRPQWFEPYQWYGSTLTTYTEPIWNDAGKMIGVTGLDMNITGLSQLLGSTDHKGQTILLSSTGVLISYPPDPAKAKALASYKDIPYLKQHWKQISAQLDTHGSIVQVGDTYLASQRIQGAGWIMLIVVPRSEVLAPVWGITVQGAVLAGLLLTGIVSLFVKRLNRRLQSIVQRCHQLSSRHVQNAVATQVTPVNRVNPASQPDRLKRAHNDELDILEQTVEYMAAQITTILENLEDRVVERTSELSQTLQTLKTTQVQLIQSEKMSSLGQMVAGVAHEINNPNNFIHGNLQHLESYTQELIKFLQDYQAECSASHRLQAELEDFDLPYVQQDIPNLLASMRSGTERIRTIVQSLRSFSRLDESSLKSVNLHDGLDSTLVILASRLNSTDRRLSVNKEYAADVPNVECYGGNLNQVFFNIISNAIDAIDSCQKPHHEIKISTKMLSEDTVLICVSDTGEGIPDDMRSRIFDPFFTTKPVGKGTGLGLSVSYQIITEQHKGKLTCDSSPGVGSKFAIEIPVQQSEAKSATGSATESAAIL